MMSNKLALSATISVLMMTAFVLFGPQTRHAELGPRASIPQLAVPSVSGLLPLR